MSPVGVLAFCHLTCFWRSCADPESHLLTAGRSRECFPVLPVLPHTRGLDSCS